MKVAIEETDRRRAVQEQYNVDHGIEPTTIIKGIHDINDRLRAVAERTVVYSSERRAATLEAADKAEVERLVARMEAEMKQAAKELEFERAAAIRDEIQQVRLRVLEQDASVVVQRAAERAAKDALLPAKERAAAHRPGQRPERGGQALEVMEVTVLPAGEEPAQALDGVPPEADDPWGVAAELFPGIRDEHDDEDGQGWQARWLDRPTWDVQRDAERPQADRAAAHAARPRLRLIRDRRPPPGDAMPMPHDRAATTKLVCTIGPATEDRDRRARRGGHVRRAAQLRARHGRPSTPPA